MMNVQGKLLDECTTVEVVREVMAMEQFLNTLPTEKLLLVMERKP